MSWRNIPSSCIEPYINNSKHCNETIHMKLCSIRFMIAYTNPRIITKDTLFYILICDSCINYWSITIFFFFININISTYIAILLKANCKINLSFIISKSSFLLLLAPSLLLLVESFNHLRLRRWPILDILHRNEYLV